MNGHAPSNEEAPADSNWSWTGSAGIAGPASAIMQGTPRAPEGSQLAYLSKDGSMSQKGSVDPGKYTLSFQAMQASGNESPQIVRVTVQEVISNKDICLVGEHDRRGARRDRRGGD